MKLRLSAPEALVDLARIPRALAASARDGDELVIGATTRHQDVIASAEVRAEARCLPRRRAASATSRCAIAARSAARSRTPTRTPTCRPSLLALGATIDGARPVRRAHDVAADDFFVDYLQTSLADDELLVAVRVPGGRRAVGAYAKFHRRAMDWSIVGAAPSSQRRAAAAWRSPASADAPCAPRAFEEALNGGGSLEDAARRAGEGTTRCDDLDGSAEYKRHLAGVIARRALKAAG